MKPGGKIAEIGTAFGEGARSIIEALGPNASFITVEPDPGRYAFARDALAGERAEVLHGHWEDVLPPRGPFDLVFFDGGTRGETLSLAVDVLAIGGILIKDDLTPGAPIAGDPVREAFLLDPRLVATEIMTSAEVAVIIAVRRG